VSFRQTIATVIDCLDRAQVPYMVTGSLASSYYGEPRSTLDIDIVIAPTQESLNRLVDGLIDAGLDVDRSAASEALRARSQFNAVDGDAVKVDFSVRKDRAFSVTEFDRRQPADLLGTQGFIASAEDVVLAKLEWATATDSERQLRDAAAIVEVGADLDDAYIDRWAGVLDVRSEWQSIRHTSGDGPPR
jgi:hypothetical protein